MTTKEVGEGQGAAPGEPATTSWAAVAACTAAGALAAMQIGKAAALLPLIREDFGAGLAVASGYVSTVSLVVALAGVLFGRFATIINLKTAGVSALVVIAVGSAVSAAATSFGLMLAARLVEAAGYAMAVATMPALIVKAVTPSDRPVALAIWSTWLPGGIAIAMAVAFALSGPVGWRGVYALMAGLAVASALAVMLAVPRVREPAAPAASIRVSRETLEIGFTFLCFSIMSMMFFGLLPTVLNETMGLSVERSNLVGSLATAALLPTNVLTGWLIAAGMSARRLFFATGAMMGLSFLALASPELPMALRVVAALGFGIAAGVPPALVWLSIPGLARGGDAPPVISGALIQAAGIGQFTGPLLGGWAAEASGDWRMIGVVAAGVSVVMVLAATRLREDWFRG